MSIRIDEENQEIDILGPEDNGLVEIPDIDLDLEDGEVPTLDEEELE